VDRNQGIHGNPQPPLASDSTAMIARQLAPASALVTGSHGFVGSHLCRILSEHGCRVVAASRRPGGTATMRGVVDASLPFLSDPEKWQRALVSIDCVVHLAGMAHQSGSAGRAVRAFQTANVEVSRFVAEQAVRAGVRRFVFVSSIKVNGEGGSLKPYRADDVPNPSDAYARTKLEAEQLLRDICRRGGMELVIVRSPLVYGPGVRANFQRLLHLASLGLPLPLGSIDNRRSMIGVSNLAHFIEVCAMQPCAAGNTWLISDGEDLSTPGLVRKLAHLMHRPARLFPFPPALLRRVAHIVGFGADVDRLCDSLVVDATPAYQCLNWRPPISVDEGLASTVEAYCARHRA
jgi:nucleoside-diphosphate-sugar epimerase